MSKTSFGLLRSLNGAPNAVRSFGGRSHSFPAKIVESYFTSDRLTDRFIRRLVSEHVLKWKEILESFEFFEQTRKHLRRPTLADVCCGHGLVGILYALLVEEVESVVLADAEIPPNLEPTLEIACSLGPWVERKVKVLDVEVEAVASHVPPATAVVSAHGCGRLTDQALDLAMQLGGPVAVMPCCCHPRSPEAPAVLYHELGVKEGVDVHRTYRLHDAGYTVLWRYIPEDVTPMNRIILGTKDS